MTSFEHFSLKNIPSSKTFLKKLLSCAVGMIRQIPPLPLGEGWGEGDAGHAQQNGIDPLFPHPCPSPRGRGVLTRDTCGAE
jgi:hypothetical protein